jgi:antitoxin (DNA-binding transcriptional repressor) of toxin-antitoxin stability system
MSWKVVTMVRMSVRDIRLKWPEAERRLAKAGEIIVTRDSVPVARIVPFRPATAARRRRFDPAAQTRWLRAFWKGRRSGPRSDELLQRDRSE